jgi:aflatoxin B1 aldehyde reductase
MQSCSALRWVSHHSLMKREYGDSIIIGASSLEHIEQNLVNLEKGPLHSYLTILFSFGHIVSRHGFSAEEVVHILDETWLNVKPHAINYWH